MRHDPLGLHTYEGQLGSGPWRPLDGDPDHLGSRSGHTIRRQKLDCRLGGTRHDREDGMCMHCGKERKTR